VGYDSRLVGGDPAPSTLRDVEITWQALSREAGERGDASVGVPDDNGSREKVLSVEEEPREAVLRGIEIAPACCGGDYDLYIERWLKVALEFEVNRSDWSTEWYYGIWPSRDLRSVFGDHDPSARLIAAMASPPEATTPALLTMAGSDTLRIAEALPLGARFKVLVYEGGGVAEVISQGDLRS